MSHTAGPPTTGEMDRVDRLIARLPPRLRWAAGVVRLTVREPADGFDRMMARARSVAAGQPQRHEYAVDRDWQPDVHAHLGLVWPCSVCGEFEYLWPQIVEQARARGLSLGRGTYGGWDDADPGFARAVWCLTIHTKPAKVVETGVARGVTSRVILEAFERTGTGHLWSIDLPAMDPSLHHEIGLAVPEDLRARWTYIAGTSRRRLPRLLQDVGPIHLFVHDSSHTERNVRFELGQAWPAMARGAIVADDVEQSCAFSVLTAQLPSEAWYVAAADDARARFGIALKDLQAPPAG
jgi:Methyltransferase domain